MMIGWVVGVVADIDNGVGYCPFVCWMDGKVPYGRETGEGTKIE